MITGELRCTRYASADGGRGGSAVPRESRDSISTRLGVAGCRWRTRAAQAKPKESCGAQREKENSDAGDGLRGLVMVEALLV